MGFFDWLIGLFGGGSRPKPAPPPKRAEEPPPRATIPTPPGVPASVPPVTSPAAPEVTPAAPPAPATPPISTAPVSSDFVANLKAVDPTPLGPEDFAAAATRLNCEVAALHAVVDVECGPKGAGFDKKGRPTILFEPHWFGQLTVPKYKYNDTHPDISYVTWGTKPYPNVDGNWARLTEAYALDPVAALAATSWGRFQIMGFNHQLCGYADVMSFVQGMLKSEPSQLEAFEKFVRAKGIDDDLRDKHWDGFAQVYNGSGYKKNQYDTKLATAYASWKSKGVGA